MLFLGPQAIQWTSLIRDEWPHPVSCRSTVGLHVDRSGPQQTWKPEQRPLRRPAAQPAHQVLSKKTPVLWGNLEVTRRHTGGIEHVALGEGPVVGP